MQRQPRTVDAPHVDLASSGEAVAVPDSDFSHHSTATAVDTRLKKAVEAIAIRPKSGRITMLMRKSYNVLLHNAMEQGEERAVYRIRLAPLMGSVSPGSNDYETLKLYLKKMNVTQVEWYSANEKGVEKSWGVSTLLAEAEIINDQVEGLTLEYSFAPKIKRRLLDPVVYAQLSLRFQSALRSNASVALYEICARYVTNPSHLTMRESWQWWRSVLTGTPESENQEFTEYKYFKRDVIKPALSEVNRLTDLEAELIEHKVGRRVVDVQFRVVHKRQNSLNLGDGPLIDAQLLQRMVALGISPKDAQELYVEHEEGLIKATIELVEDRLKKEGLKEVHSIPAFFRSALRGRYATPKLAQAKKPRKATQAPDQVLGKVRDAYRAKLAANARHMFNESDETTRKEWLSQFLANGLPEGGGVVLTEYKKKGLKSKLAETAFITWLVKTHWGDEPTESDLLNFAIQEGLLTAK